MKKNSRDAAVDHDDCDKNDDDDDHEVKMPKTFSFLDGSREKCQKQIGFYTKMTIH